MKDKKKKTEWVILGVGNLIGDIIDAIEENNNVVAEIILNTDISINILKKLSKEIEVKKIENLMFDKNKKYIFGFLNPEKDSFLVEIKKKNINLANLIHPFASISKKATIGEGNYFAAGTVIAADVRIGNHNFFNRNSSVGHDTKIGDFNHVGPGSTISGRCKIANKSFLGTGSVVKDGIKIISGVNIGAGSVVVKDIKEKGTYVGVPANKYN